MVDKQCVKSMGGGGALKILAKKVLFVANFYNLCIWLMGLQRIDLLIIDNDDFTKKTK
jgi:hypothetical protein